MKVIQFPKQKPAPGHFDLAQAIVSGIVHDLTAVLMKSHLDLMNAHTAEQFAAAIAEIHATLTDHAAGFAELVGSTRDWTGPPKGGAR